MTVQRHRQSLLAASISVRLVLVGFIGLALRLFLPSRVAENRGEPTLLLGNGPSLAQDLNKLELKNYESVAAVNFFAATEWFDVVKPSYYFVQDTYWFDENNLREKASLTFDAIRKKLSWEMDFFYPAEFSRSTVISELSEIPGLNLRPLRHHSWPPFASLVSAVDLLPQFSSSNRKIVHRLWDMKLASVPPVGVVSNALFELILSGSKKIDILGLDMSMVLDLRVDSDGSTQFLPKHFYGTAVTPETPLARTNTMSNSYIKIAKKFESFYLLEGYARHRGCVVRNLSSFTLLDAFRNN